MIDQVTCLPADDGCDGSFAWLLTDQVMLFHLLLVHELIPLLVNSSRRWHCHSLGPT
jgi:hypothetical protein